MTVYHRDRASLVATHYCPQGNQPRLDLARARMPGTIRFEFRDATDLDVRHENYLVALAFDLSDAQMARRRESYRERGKDIPSELKLVRDPGN